MQINIACAAKALAFVMRLAMSHGLPMHVDHAEHMVTNAYNLIVRLPWSGYSDHGRRAKARERPRRIRDHDGKRRRGVRQLPKNVDGL
jgi:hypothetical protein